MAVQINYRPPNSSGGGGPACVEFVTYAQLSNLIDTSGLQLHCIYFLSDFAQGNLGVAPLLIRAVSNVEIAQTVLVNPTFEPVSNAQGGVFDMYAWIMGGFSAGQVFANSWSGLYDVNQNQLIELSDDKGNTVYDPSGDSINNFDWGNANITNCLVRGSVWTQAIGSALEFSNCTFLNSVIDTSHQTVGSFKFVDVAQSTVVIGTGVATGKAALEKCSIRDSSNIAFSGTGTLTATGSTFTGSTISHVNQSGNLTITSSQFNTGLVTHSGSRNLTIQYSRVENNSDVQSQNSGGSDSIRRSVFSCGTTVLFNCSGSDIIVDSLAVSNQSSVTFAGTSGNLFIGTTQVGSGSSMTFTDCVGAFPNEGNFSENALFSASNASFTGIAGGTGTRTFRKNTIVADSDIAVGTVSSNIAFSIESNFVSNVGLLALPSTIGATTSVKNSRVTDGSILNVSSGATVLRCSAENGATWTAGAFSHTDSRLRGATTVTSSAGNTNAETNNNTGALT